MNMCMGDELKGGGEEQKRDFVMLLHEGGVLRGKLFKWLSVSSYCYLYMSLTLWQFTIN